MYNTALSTSLWMGDLDGSLDEASIISAFAQLGEVAVGVKMHRDGKNSTSTNPDNYCFVEFPDVDSAQRVLQRFNGRNIPGQPGKRFKLNPASFGRDNELLPEFSLFVGELSWNVDDYNLFAFFQKRYKSVRGAKVVLDQNGKSRGFGFVRFSEEGEQQKALIEMQHMTGLGRRPIRVSLASIKRSSDHATSSAPQTLSTSHSSYYAGHYSWGGYNYHYTQSYPQPAPYPSADHEADLIYPYDSSQVHESAADMEDDSEVLEDPDLEMNVAKENREFIESSESFFTALDKSRWQPLDNIYSAIPD